MKIMSIGRKGFTLAELLISVAITGMLVSVAIPVMKDALLSSKESICYSNQQAAKAEFSIGYVLGDYNTVISKRVLPDDMKKEYSCPSGGTLFYEISAKGDVTVTCSVHANVIDGSQVALTRQDMDTIVAAIKNLTDTKVSVDSEAVEGSNAWKTALIAELKTQGIDFEAMGIKSWRVNWDYIKGKEKTLRFEFTTAEISELPVGSKIPVIRYRPDGNPNGDYKGYSVWEASVASQTGGFTYNIIGVATSNREYSGNSYDKLSTDDKQDINKIIDVYNKYNTQYPDIIK